VFVDNNNKTGFFASLDYYRSNQQQMRRVAVTGYLHSMYHHRAANLMDYVLKTVEHRREVEAYVRQKRSGDAVESFKPVSELDILHLDPATEQGLVTTHTHTGYDMKRFILSEVKRTANTVPGKGNLVMPVHRKHQQEQQMQAPAVGGSVEHEQQHKQVRAAMLGFERRRR
jgi:hypothetical protein